MKRTLLDMVQDILNDMDADNVNSIQDTVESDQVANIVKSCYLEMMSNRNWPHMRKLCQMDAVNDLTKPNYLKIPVNLKEMVFFKYQVQKNETDSPVVDTIKFLYPDEFLNVISRRSGDNVQIVTDFSGAPLPIYNDRAPQYWTTFDDVHIVTDSYNQDIDTTLQASRSLCMAFFMPTWTMEDEFIPDLPAEAFSALIEEAKSTAFVALKQMANQKAEQKANRQQRWLSRKAWTLQGGVRYDDYGRKGRR